MCGRVVPGSLCAEPNRDYMEALEEDAARGSPALFGRWTIRVMQTARALEANANARLAMDDLMLCLALAR